jgi:hypothetical protein
MQAMFVVAVTRRDSSGFMQVVADYDDGITEEDIAGIERHAKEQDTAIINALVINVIPLHVPARGAN